MTAAVLQGLLKARVVVLELESKGFPVAAVEIDAFERRPIIWLAGGERCERLNGRPTIRVDENGNRDEIMALRMQGCRVQWRAA